MPYTPHPHPYALPMPVQIIWHPSSLDHDPGPGHPESPARIKAILEELRLRDYSPIVEWSETAPAESRLLERVHPCAYLGNDTRRPPHSTG